MSIMAAGVNGLYSFRIVGICIGQSIDVGAKQEIFKLIERLTERGRGVILISSYLPEVMGLSDRLIVMAQGKITAEYDKEALKTLTEADVLRMASIED